MTLVEPEARPDPGPAPVRRRPHWVAWLLAACLVGAVVHLRKDRAPPPEPEGAPVSSKDPPEAATPGTSLRPRPAGGVASRATPVEAPARLADLEALASADPAAVRAAASRLRHDARTVPAVLEALRAALLDPATSSDLRARLAVVLGTIDAPEIDGVLLDALARFGADPAFTAAAVLALGLQRTPADDDEVFDLAARPHGAAGPGGLGVTVRRRIEDADTRAALVRFAAHAAADVRYAAARALAESAAFPDTRTALVGALARETEDGVAARLGEPLATWAATAELGPDRDAVLSALLDRALAPGADETRFRMEKDLARSDLAAGLLDRLLSGSDASRPPEVRAFALTVLPGAALRSGSDAVLRVRRTLEDVLGKDARDDLRDLAARQLGTLPSTDATVAALARAAREDRAWQVRFSAVTALGRDLSRPSSVEALRSAGDDPDPRVSAEARRLLPR